MPKKLPFPSPRKARLKATPFTDLEPGDAFQAHPKAKKQMLNPTRDQFYLRTDEDEWPVLVMTRATLSCSESKFVRLCEEFGVIRVKVKIEVTPC